MGMLGILLAFGLMMGGCEITPKTADIKLTNASSDTIYVDVQAEGSKTVAKTDSVGPGVSTSFSLDSGKYRVRVDSGTWISTWDYWPQDRSYTDMSGTFNLTYDGYTIEKK